MATIYDLWECEDCGEQEEVKVRDGMINPSVCPICRGRMIEIK